MEAFPPGGLFAAQTDWRLWERFPTALGSAELLYWVCCLKSPGCPPHISTSRLLHDLHKRNHGPLHRRTTPYWVFSISGDGHGKWKQFLIVLTYRISDRLIRTMQWFWYLWSISQCTSWLRFWFPNTQKSYCTIPLSMQATKKSTILRFAHECSNNITLTLFRPKVWPCFITRSAGGTEYWRHWILNTPRLVAYKEAMIVTYLLVPPYLIFTNSSDSSCGVLVFMTVLGFFYGCKMFRGSLEEIHHARRLMASIARSNGFVCARPGRVQVISVLSFISKKMIIHHSIFSRS